MNDLDDSFTRLLGRQPTDTERQALYRVRDALKLKTTDAVWLLLMALQYYETLYDKIPARIAEVTRDVASASRAAAEAQAKAAQAETKKALMKAVHEAAVASTNQVATAERFKWTSVAAVLILAGMMAMFRWGANAGRADGVAEARTRCEDASAAASWANTPEGHLAFGLAKAGSIRDLATCARPGWEVKARGCIVRPHKGTIYGWNLPMDDRKQ